LPDLPELYQSGKLGDFSMKKFLVLFWVVSLFGFMTTDTPGFDWALPDQDKTRVGRRGFLEIVRLQNELNKHPTHSHLLVELGALYFRRGHLSRARSYFNSALNRKYYTATLYYYLGLLAMKDNSPVAAEKNFLRALSMGKQQNPEHFVSLSLFYLKEKRFDAGLRWAALGLKLHPHSLRLRVLSSFQLIKLKRFKEAELTLIASRRLDPGNSAIPYNLACLYAQLGDQDASIYHLRKAARNGYLKPHFPMLDESFDSFRTHPQFQLALQDIGLNEKKFYRLKKLKYRVREKRPQKSTQ
jgi:tetratricopeptide (TPR) repeat protein